MSKLVINLINVNSLVNVFENLDNIYNISDFKHDFYIHGEDYCLEKYSDKIDVYSTISLFNNIKFCMIKYSNLYNNENIQNEDNSNLFITKDISNIEKSFSIYKAIRLVTILGDRRHKIITDNEDIIYEFEEFNNIITNESQIDENYSCIHIMNIMSVSEIYNEIKLMSGDNNSVNKNYIVFLYNYNQSILSILGNIFNENLIDISKSTDKITFNYMNNF